MARIYNSHSCFKCSNDIPYQADIGEDPDKSLAGPSLTYMLKEGEVRAEVTFVDKGVVEFTMVCPKCHNRNKVTLSLE